MLVWGGNIRRRLITELIERFGDLWLADAEADRRPPKEKFFWPAKIKCKTKRFGYMHSMV